MLTPDAIAETARLQAAARRVIPHLRDRGGLAGFLLHCELTGWRPTLRADLHGDDARRLAAAMRGGRCHLWDPRGEVAA